MSDGADFSALLEPVARRLLGDPGPLSSEDVLRFGPSGALHVDLTAHRWWDVEDEAAGGDVIALVEYRTGLANGEAVEWVHGHGFSLAKSEIIVPQHRERAGEGKSPGDPAPPPRELINLELEQQLLGALLMHPGQTAGVAFTLKPEHFSEPLHRRLYDIITELSTQGKHVSPVTIQPYLPATPDFDIRGYIAKLAAAYAGAPADAYASGIIELAIARTLVTVGEDIAAAARAPDPAEPAKAQIEAAITKLTTLASSGLRPMLRASSVGAAARVLVEEFDAPTPKRRPVSTGLVELDKLIGGYHRGEFYILAGRPGIGKSLVAGSSALQVARRGDGAVIIFSMEMTKAAFTARLICDQVFRDTLPLLYRDILDGSLDDDRRALLKQGAREIENFPLVIDPQPGLTIAEIGVRAARYIEAFAKRGITTPALVVVDHLGKIKRPGKWNDNTEIGLVTGRGAELAKELDACFLMLCQLNRAVDSRDNNWPQLTDLRDSGNIEQDADVVLMIYRQAYYLARQKSDDPEKELARNEKLQRVGPEMEIIVAKNRGHGSEGTARVWCHMGAGIVRDREERY